MVQDRFKFAGRAIFFYVGTLTKSLLTIRENLDVFFCLSKVVGGIVVPMLIGQ